MQMVSDLVCPGKVLADIGTDHAYLPVYLCQKGMIPRALACDIRIGPLENAKNTVKVCGYENQIECRLGSGLEPVKEGEAEEIVIAGMGGETIVSILSACPWVQSSQIHLILQPMTHAEDVRRYLFENGFSVLAEQTTQDEKHTYICFSAVYTGETIQPSTTLCFAGSVGIQTMTESDRQYLENLTRYLMNLTKKHEAGSDSFKELEECIQTIQSRLNRGNT